MTISTLLSAITPASREAKAAAQAKWNAVGKPLGSLGILEDLVITMAGVFGTPDFSIDSKAVAIFCGDNGVVAEGVTQSGQEVTTVVAANMARRRSSVCKMARIANARIFPVDVGMATPVDHPGIWNRSIAPGTRNFTKVPAMTRAQAEAAILVGFETVERLYADGARLIATGEMGIGNTTTSAAVLSVLLDCSPAEMTGRGAGLSSDGLDRKIRAIEVGLSLHRPTADDPIGLLSAVGGFDLAAICGAFLGGAYFRVPVIVDGLISAAGALCAVKLCPHVREYLLASHLSKEPAGRPVLEALGATPILQAEMRLGEGTGAVALMPLLDMAMTVYNGDTFDDIQIAAYTPQN